MMISKFTFCCFLLYLHQFSVCSSSIRVNGSAPAPPRGKNCKRPLFFMYCQPGECGEFNGHALECRPTEDERYRTNRSAIPNQCLCPRDVNCTNSFNENFAPLSGDCSELPCIKSFGHQFNPNSTDECQEPIHCFSKVVGVHQTEFSMCLTCSECRNKNIQGKRKDFGCAEICNGTDVESTMSIEEEQDEEFDNRRKKIIEEKLIKKQEEAKREKELAISNVASATLSIGLYSVFLFVGYFFL